MEGVDIGVRRFGVGVGVGVCVAGMEGGVEKGRRWVVGGEGNKGVQGD